MSYQWSQYNYSQNGGSVSGRYVNSYTSRQSHFMSNGGRPSEDTGGIPGYNYPNPWNPYFGVQRPTWNPY